MSTFGSRIVSERERLGLSQEAFAAQGGVTRKTQSNYERGIRIPDAVYLEAISSAGVDVSFIISGTKSSQADAPTGPVNQEWLALAIEAVDRGLDSRKRTMSSDSKARVVSAVYDLIATGTDDKQIANVLRLVS